MTANTVRSRKQKGMNFQKIVKDLILKYIKELDEEDLKVAVSGETGQDIYKSPKAKKIFPFAIEAKRTEKLNIWSAIEQAEENKDKTETAIVVFKRNRSDIYCTLKFEEFLKLLERGAKNV